ncbi:MAG: hypothetical protein AAGI11_09830 [Pseudomonadota bacterium]
MANRLAAAFVAALISIGPAIANALTITLSGVAGEGTTTASFSGSTTASESRQIRDPSASDYDGGDSFEPGFIGGVGDEDWLIDASLSGLVVALTGDATVSFGGSTYPLVSLFLDDDTGENGGTASDDFGFRVSTPQAYTAGQVLTFAGSGQFAIDISSFAPGTYDSLDTNTDVNLTSSFFSDDEVVTLIIESTAGTNVGGAAAQGIPTLTGSALAILILSVMVLGGWRSRPSRRLFES